MKNLCVTFGCSTVKLLPHEISIFLKLSESTGWARTVMGRRQVLRLALVPWQASGSARLGDVILG